MNTELDSFPVSELGDRYHLDRSNIYNRLGKLGIKPEKIGSKSFLNAEQLRLMDDLDAHIKNGGTIADFQTVDRPARQARQSHKTTGQLLSQVPQDQSTITAFLNAIAPQKADPFEQLEQLERAAEKGWHLSSSQLAPLLGLKTLGKSPIQRFGFTCIKVGKNGAQSAWKVAKSPEG
jgi:hypothetical protein